MEPAIIVAIITAGGSLIGTAITAMKNRNLNKVNENLNAEKQDLNKAYKNLNDEKQNLSEANKNLKTHLKDVKLISKGMMVGYFFNFIKPLFDSLERPGISITDDETKSVYKVSRENMKLEVIIPKTLNNADLHEATIFKSSFKKGIIVENEKIIFRDIKYRIEEGSSNIFIVVDVPNPFESAVKYYKGAYYQNPDDRKELIERELTNFEETINELITNTQELDGKVRIRRPF